MEHVVNSRASKEIELVSDRANALQHLEGTKILKCKLVISVWSYRSSNVWLQLGTQVHNPNDKDTVRSALVSLLLC